MAINDIVQAVAEARIDARSLSEFVFKPAGFKVTRRLAPPVDTLQFYIDRLNSLNGDFSSSVSAALSSLNSSVVEADGKVAYIETTVQDAINNTAIEGGVLADTLVTVTATKKGAVARNQREKNAENVSIKDFGGICDGTLHTAQEWIGAGKRFDGFTALKASYPTAVSEEDSIDSLALEAALATIGNKGNVKLHGRPVFNKPYVFPLQANGICIYADHIIDVVFTHTGDGFDFTLANENVGKNELRNMNIRGPDPIFPPLGYVHKSAGKGIKISRAYDNTFTNVTVGGFLFGWWLRTGFNNKAVGFCSAVGNGYGVYIAGGATNLNNFDRMKIRLNYIAGVYIGNEGGGPFPTRNYFRGCYIETNIPYKGGYIEPPGDGSHSVGVRIKQGYGNDFSGTYFENQDFDIWLEDRASYNIFDHVRQAPEENGLRNARIMLKGANVNGNSFVGAEYVSFGDGAPNVISDNTQQLYNKFDNTIGYTFDESVMLCYASTSITNTTKHALVNGDSFGAITRNPQGYRDLELTDISGVGTTNAIINAKGLGEILLGGTITNPTTVTSISGLRKGQIFVLANYQIAHPVTIKASANGYSGLILHNGEDAILRDYSDSITFYVIGVDRVVEIGRSVRGDSTVIIEDTKTFAMAKGEGTAPGQISGIGTLTATLNATNLTEIMLHTEITAPTTIISASGLKNGQLFTISNNQNVHPITIKANTTFYSGFIMDKNLDAVLRRPSDSITFKVLGVGRVVELGRNISTV